MTLILKNKKNKKINVAINYRITNVLNFFKVNTVVIDYNIIILVLIWTLFLFSNYFNNFLQKN